MNAITYSGIPVNLDTEEIQAHLDSWLPFADSRFTTPPRVYPGPRLLGATRPLHNVNRPQLRFGQWFYPVGMSRWSEVHLLVSSDYYQPILDVAFDDTGTPLPNALSFNQGDTTISTKMYVLDMRPIVRMTGQPSSWIMTLVDERYYFNFSPMVMSVASTTLWTDLINDVKTALDITASNDTIPSTYLQPEPQSDLNALYENAAILAEAIAVNVGMRWVRKLDGTYKLMSPSSAATIATANKATVKTWLAGGDSLQDAILSNGTFPQSVKVSFLKWNNGSYVNPQRDHIPYSKNTGDEYAVTIALDSLPGFTTFTGSSAVKVYHCTGKALFASLVDAIPTNITQLNNLAQQIAFDYYSWLNDGLDITYDLLAWKEQEGYHDVTWTWDRKGLSTRVSHLPWNYGTEELLHGISGTPASGSGGGGSGGVGGSFTVVESFNPTSCTVTYVTFTYSEDGRLISVS